MRADLVATLRCPATGGALGVEPVRAQGDEVLFALLHSDLGVYPVLAGIPVFTDNAGELADLVQAGRLDDAVTRAAFGHLSWSRVGQSLRALGDGLGRLRRYTGAAEERLSERELRRAAPVLAGADGRGPDVAALEHAFLRSRRPNPDGFDYFVFRLGTPRHLVALALIEQITPPTGPVLDVGCGLGHLTWALGGRHPEVPVVGVDVDFLGLMFARTRVARDASFVCADARWLPFVDDAFTLAFSSDMLPYVREKRAAVDEMERVTTDDGVLVLTALRNRYVEHVYGGEPLSPDGWLDLLDGYDTQLFGDACTLERYLARTGPKPTSPETARHEQTVSVVASLAPVHVDEGGFDGWPHARGTLSVHPLLEARDGCPTDGVEYERRFPSATYERDHPLLATYLPPRVNVSRAVFDQARAGDDGEELDNALARVAVLGLPDPLVDEPWPGFALSDAR